MPTDNTTGEDSDMGACLAKTPMDRYLEKQGIFPDKKFADYSAYIEDAQKTKTSKLLHNDVVPVRGSIHMSTDRMKSTEEKTSILSRLISRFF